MRRVINKLKDNEGRPHPISLQDLVRIALHIPVGLFATWFIYQNPTAGLVFGFGFLVYEIMEDLRIADRSYKDILGYLIGMALMGVALSLAG